MDYTVDFNAQFGQAEGAYNRKIAVTINAFDFQKVLGFYFKWYVENFIRLSYDRKFLNSRFSIGDYQNFITAWFCILYKNPFQKELLDAVQTALIQSRYREAEFIVHSESGLYPRYGYYNQPLVKADAWQPEQGCIANSFISSIAYPPKRLNVTKFKRTPLYNAAKDDITNLEKYALYYYTDIEDEQNDTENEMEETPVAVVETDFKEWF